MRKWFGMLVTLALCSALALSLGCALVGCKSVDKTRYTGDWVLVSSTDSDLDADSIALMKSIGNDVKLVLNEDGTGTLSMFDEFDDVKWEASSETEAKLTRGSATTAMTLDEEGKELKLADVNGAQLTFSR